jgi:hypothetical protein
MASNTPTPAINKLKVNLDKIGLPNCVVARFNDGQILKLDFVKTWRQCFATLSGGEERVFSEASYRNYFPEGVQTTEMTRRDYANVCFAYYSEMNN